MKQNFLKWMVCMCFGLLSVATVMAGGNYKTVKVKAPFPCLLYTSDAADEL